MAEGYVDVTPEVADFVAPYLPRTVTEISREQYGGAIRIKISGDELVDGKSYQLVVTDEPMRRCIELKQNPGA